MTTFPHSLTVAVATIPSYKSLQEIGNYKPTSPVTVTGQYFQTGIDLTEADMLFLSVTDDSGEKSGHTGWIDCSGSKAKHYYWNHDNAYLSLYITNRSTGVIQIKDLIRGAMIKEITAFKRSVNGVVIPTATIVATERLVTVVSPKATVNSGKVSVKVLEGIPTMVQLDLNDGKGIDLTLIPDYILPSTAGAKVLVVDPIKGYVSVTAGAGDTAITLTETQNATYKGLQVVGEYVPVTRIAMTGSMQEIETKIDFTKCSAIEFDIADANGEYIATSQTSAKIAYGSDRAGLAHWHDSGHLAVRFDDVTAKTAGKLKIKHANISLTVIGIRGLAYAENGFVVPTGTTLQNQVVIKATTDLQPSLTHSGSDTFKAVELTTGYYSVVPGVAKILRKITPSKSSVVATVTDQVAGTFSLNIPAGTGDFTIKAETANLNANETLIFDHEYTSDQAVTVSDGKNIGNLLDEYDFWRVEVYEGIGSRFHNGTVFSTENLQSKDSLSLMLTSYQAEYMWLKVAGSGKNFFRLQNQITIQTSGMGANTSVKIWGVKGNVALPTNYKTPALRTITLSPANVTAGITFANGLTSMEVLEGMVSHSVFLVPDGKQIKTIWSMTSGKIYVKNLVRNEFYVVPVNDSVVEIQIVDKPALTKSKLVLSGPVNAQFNSHSGATDFSNFTKLLDEDGDLLCQATASSTFVFKKTAMVAIGMTIDSAGANVGNNLWPRILGPNSVGVEAVLVDDNHNATAARLSKFWEVQKTLMVTDGTTIRLQARANNTFVAGSSTATVFITEL